MKKLIFSLIVTILSVSLLTSASATTGSVQKTYTWKYNVNKDATVSFDNYNCNMTIHAWDKGEAEFHLIVDATARSAEDAATLDTYLQNMKFSNTAGSVSFRDNFWNSRNNILGRTTMKLENGKSVSLSEFTMKGELWIPAGCKLNLTSKYSEINMENFTGPVNLDLYNDNLTCGNLSGKTDIKDNYSTLEFGDMKDVTADFYNTKLEAKNTGNLKLVSKYSKINALSSGALDVDGYNDNYSITRTGDITYIAKYSDLKTDVSGKVTLDCYEGTVILKEAKNITIETQYADFQIGNAEDIDIRSSYNDKFVMLKANLVKSANSKYCSYRIDELKVSFSDADGYEDKITLGKTGSGFTGININGQYTEVNLSLPKTLDYRFKAKITYPKLIIDESQMKPIVKIKDDSQVEYNAVKGTEKEGMPVIEINGYEMTLKIVEV